MAEDQPTTPSSTRRVVVGVDGSAPAQAALASALEEARLRQASLEVVFAWQFPFEMAAGSLAVPTPAGEMALWADDVLDKALADVDLDDRVPVVRHPGYGPAVEVLMEAAQGAELLVVGSRGHNRVSGLLLGSVSQHLAVNAPCPVLVVHGPGAVARITTTTATAAAPPDGHDAGTHASTVSDGRVEPHGDLEEIPEDECWALLAGHSVGRLVVVHRDAPRAFPVNYVLDRHTVAVRTNSGETLDWATLGKVAFEIDAVDEEHHVGWSVLVQGVGRDVTDGIDDWSEHLRAQALEPWAGGDRRHWIAIASPRISGRRIRQVSGAGVLPTPS